MATRLGGLSQWTDAEDAATRADFAFAQEDNSGDYLNESHLPLLVRFVRQRILVSAPRDEVLESITAIAADHFAEGVVDHHAIFDQAMDSVLETAVTGDGARPVTQNERDEERRQRQIEINKSLQDKVEEGVAAIPPEMNLDQMLAELVDVSDGAVVVLRSNPAVALPTAHMARRFNSNLMTRIVVGANGQPREKTVPTFTVWETHAGHVQVFTRTFAPGRPAICRDPDGLPAINYWKPIRRKECSGPEYEAHVSAFVGHVRYIFQPSANPTSVQLAESNAEAEKFLDWLAHIEQKPGQLPHYGWVHVATKTGLGRNWIASVIARVWMGYVAPSVDPQALLKSEFNGNLANRLIATVDEIRVGGNNKFDGFEHIKTLVTQDIRMINPKYGTQYKQFNACRWLLFSNHLDALPLNETDRRFRVVSTGVDPRPPSVYASLYNMLEDKSFADSIGWFLCQRNIADFQPGERPPMTAAKRSMIEKSRSFTTSRAIEIVNHWPCDVITSRELLEILRTSGTETGLTPGMRRSLTDAGIHPIVDRKEEPKNMRIGPLNDKGHRAGDKAWFISRP